jgi:DNA-damage-inducible protein J
MSTTNINFRVDAELKARAEQLFEEIGLPMTTALTVFLKRAVAEGRMPFELLGSEAALHKRIHAALLEAQQQAADPSTKYLTHEEAFAGVRAKYGL